jgi:hypothetical protein
MKLSAVTLARVLAFIETADLSSGANVFYPDLVAGIVEQFRFQKFPVKAEDFDEQKGVEFLGGQWEGVPVLKLVIYWNGFILDTESSTSESERIVEEALVWASGKFKLKYTSGMISRRRYLSNLTFYSDRNLLGLHPAIPKLTSSLHEKIKERTGLDLAYEVTRLDVDFARHEGQIPIAAFTIQRRGQTPFEENKYFSEAPLPTDIHINLLEQFEADTVD